MNPNLLNDHIGQIAVNLNLMTPEAQARMLEVQARCVAAAAKGAISTAAAANNDTQWAAEKTRLGIDDAALETARTQVKSGAGVDAKSVPASGQIAVAIGGIDADIEVALLTAQASQRAISAIPAIYDANIPYTQNPALFGHMSEHDNPVLKFAQTVNQLAANSIALVRDPASLAAAPELRQQTQQELAEGLKAQALTAYHGASVLLGVRAAELAKADDPRATRAAEVADELNQSVIALGGAGITGDELAAYAADRAQAESAKKSGWSGRITDEKQKPGNSSPHIG